MKLPDPLVCDLCGHQAEPDDWSDVASMFVCETCREAMIETRTFTEEHHATL